VNNIPKMLSELLFVYVMVFLWEVLLSFRFHYVMAKVRAFHVLVATFVLAFCIVKPDINLLKSTHFHNLDTKL